MIGYLILTDLDYPDDEPTLHIRVDTVGDFRRVERKHNEQFVSYMTVVNTTYGGTHVVTESPEEVRERLIEFYRYAEEQETAAAEAEQARWAEQEAAMRKELGLDDAVYASMPVSFEMVHEEG